MTEILGESERRTAQASPWTVCGAVAVSLLLTPVSAYFGLARWRRAAVFALTEFLCVLLAIVAIFQSSPLVLSAACLLMVAAFILATVDVARLAARTPERRHGWRSVLLGALAVAVLLGAAKPVSAHAIESFTSPKNTMLPTLTVGDRFFVDKRHRALRRGDVVVFRIPASPDHLRVKRAVALAGDTVEMREGTLVVNGSAVTTRMMGTLNLPDGSYEEWEETIDSRTYRVLRAPRGSRSTFGPVTVPEGHFFMLGDNRDRNNDSRLYDAIPLEMVVGRASLVWWSRSPAGRVRWDRVGQSL